MGFHAPEEAARILAESIDFSRKGQATLAGQTIVVPSLAPAPLPRTGEG
jgi:formate-dependent nitrite reductase cytochrome c552 subunit